MIHSNHYVDEEGRPAGGTSYGRGFAIGWQNGPIGRGEGRAEPNGAFVEDVIAAARDRLSHYQSGPFASPHNDEAIRHLTEATAALNRRTAEREARAVEGTLER